MIPKPDASTVFVRSRTSSKGYNLSAKIRPSQHQTRQSCTVHNTYNKQAQNQKLLEDNITVIPVSV
jgi:hypothetical protein